MINSTIAKKTYTGNAGVLVYPIGFQYMRDALTNAPEIEVLLDGGELEFGTDYTVSDDGLNVILSNAVANGAKIEIYRTTSMLQESDYQVGRISPEQIEKDFDRLTMRDQELAQADEDIATEVALAKARLSIVEGDIDLLEDKDSELENAISEEAENRAHDDGILLEKIEQLSARNEDYRVEAQNAIAAEATARSTAVATLQQAISEEIAERRTVDTNLNNLIRATDEKVDTKQDKLVAGKNIKIEGNEISAEGGSADVSDLENAVSVLRTDVELSTEPFTETVVLLDELYTSEIDGRPDYKKPGATVYAENGVAGIIDTVDETAGTATIVTISAGGAGGGIENLATGTQSLTILGTSAADNFSVNVGTGSSTSGTRAVAVGNVTSAKGNQAVAIGFSATSSAAQTTSVGGSAQATSSGAVSVGYNAKATATNAVQLGSGTNSASNTLQFMSRTIVDNKGIIPLARLDGVVKQFTTMPSASAYVGGIVQYIGEDGDYKKGSFYKCASETQTVYSASGYTLGGPSITINFDEAKFLAQDPVFSEMYGNAWRADGGVNGWTVFSQDPALSISNADLRDVWGIEVLGDGEPIAVDGASIQIIQQEEVTYYWVEVEFGGGAEFPDQTGNAGKFLMTNGSEVSWGSALVNGIKNNTGLGITGDGVGTNVIVTSAGSIPAPFAMYTDNVYIGTASARPSADNTTSIGSGANASNDNSIAIGKGAASRNYPAGVAIGTESSVSGGVAIGYKASAAAPSQYTVAIGYQATCAAVGAIQINATTTKNTNSDANTFKVGNNNGNFEMMSADGSIPVARLSQLVEQEPSDTGGAYIFNIGNRMVMMGGVIDIEAIQPDVAAGNIPIEFPEPLGDTTYIFPQLTIVSSDFHKLTADVSNRTEQGLEICVRNNGDQVATGVKISWQVVGMIGSGTIH